MVRGANRIVFWFLSTVTVLVLLFGYHTSTSGPASAPLSAIASVTPGATADSPTEDSGSSSGSSSSSSSSSSAITVTGDEAQTQWGPVQVQLSIADGKITDVEVPTYPNGNGRDAEINSYALPQLVKETIAAQSADIDMVSGATVTSDGYLQSLQSALDKAGL